MSRRDFGIQRDNEPELTVSYIQLSGLPCVNKNFDLNPKRFWNWNLHSTKCTYYYRVTEHRLKGSFYFFIFLISLQILLQNKSLILREELNNNARVIKCDQPVNGHLSRGLWISNWKLFMWIYCLNLHKQSIVTYKLAIIKLYDPTPVLDKHEAEFIFGKHHNFADETNIIPVGANCEVSTQESNNSTLKYPFIPNQIISIGFLRFKSDDFFE